MNDITAYFWGRMCGKHSLSSSILNKSTFLSNSPIVESNNKESSMKIPNLGLKSAPAYIESSPTKVISALLPVI